MVSFARITFWNGASRTLPGTKTAAHASMAGFGLQRNAVIAAIRLVALHRHAMQLILRQLLLHLRGELFNLTPIGLVGPVMAHAVYNGMLGDERSGADYHKTVLL